ncbi:MAG: DUF2147 domain-containing protein [Flavobacteriales bacterium]|nr:DUF2147 domain-containing protein [Flavobacteriales bacterium]
MKKSISFILVFSFFIFQSFAQRTSPVGKWKTVDDNTGKTKSVVEIYQKGGKLFGKVLELFDPPKPNPVCEECAKEDARHMKPIVGLEIIRNMQKDGNEYEDGDILDPENGKVYKCKIWVEEGKLMVRGYIAFLYRTQKWLPAD